MKLNCINHKLTFSCNIISIAAIAKLSQRTKLDLHPLPCHRSHGIRKLGEIGLSRLFDSGTKGTGTLYDCTAEPYEEENYI